MITICCTNCNKKLEIRFPENLSATSVIKCSKCTFPNLYGQYENKEDIIIGQSIEDIKPSNKENENQIGWLIVEQKDSDSQKFELKLGKQIIGRKSETLHSDIGIVTKDQSFGRQHLIIECKPKNSFFECVIYRHEAKNPTFINQNELKGTEQYWLKDGDIIQAGETKIIFKTAENNANDKELTIIANKKNYLPTERAERLKTQNKKGLFENLFTKK
jgi:pSer/pThr/pTyr-binding forkhead associated (FHA) protein